MVHGGVTKQLRPEHGADHNRCKHRALVRCSSDSLRDLSPFRICSSEVHKAERHAPIKMVEPALYAAMSRWEGTPEIDAVLRVCLARSLASSTFMAPKSASMRAGVRCRIISCANLSVPAAVVRSYCCTTRMRSASKTSAACGLCRATFQVEGNCSCWCTCGAQPLTAGVRLHAEHERHVVLTCSVFKCPLLNKSQRF